MTRILHIEDAAALREMIQVYLELHGFSVTGVASGEEGIDALQRGEYDGIVLDHNLPGISGARVVGWVTVHRPYLVPRVVVTTVGFANPALEARLESFQIPVLLKPFVLDDLLQQLTRRTVPAKPQAALCRSLFAPSGL